MMKSDSDKNAVPLVVYPHEFFRIDFDELLQEGPRQEKMLTANAGEAGEVQALHAFWDQRVLPLIRTNDEVFAAAKVFVETWAIHCFDEYEMAGKACREAQNKLHDLKERVVETLGEASFHGWLRPSANVDTVDLKKASDFYHTLDLRRTNNRSFQTRSRRLFEQARKTERQQVTLILRVLHESYGQVLPQVLMVAKRAIEVHHGLTIGPNAPVDLSEDLTWWESHGQREPALDLFVSELRGSYKVMRNAWGHPDQWAWQPKQNTVKVREHPSKPWEKSTLIDFIDSTADLCFSATWASEASCVPTANGYAMPRQWTW